MYMKEIIIQVISIDQFTNDEGEIELISND